MGKIHVKITKVIFKCLDFVSGANYFKTHTGMIYHLNLNTLIFSVLYYIATFCVSHSPSMLQE